MLKPSETPENLMHAAAEAARLGGARLKERLQSERQIEFKGAVDLVTDADRASEEVILSFLTSRYPDHRILAEEHGAVAGSGAFRWLIDPLDGTTNYAHRVPLFCVSIGVQDEQGLVAGAVYDPLLDELFEAARGLGARLNGRPLRVSTEARLDRALLASGFPYDTARQPELPLGLFNELVMESQGVRRLGSAALDLCYVAAGRFEGFVEVRLKPWDIAAGALLVQEAGGTVTGLLGEPLDLESGDVLSSNGPLHAPLLEVCRRVHARVGR